MLRVLRADPELPTWLSSLIGPDKFCHHLHALGRDANAVRVPSSRRGQGPHAPRHLVFLAPASPVQLISLRSSRGTDGRVALSHHYVIPVDPDRTGPQTYATRLGQAFGGIAGRTRTCLSFV